MTVGEQRSSRRRPGGQGFAWRCWWPSTFFMENLDATVITPAVPQMAASFGVAPVDLNIGISAYMLTLGVFIPISGWIADRYGAQCVLAAAICRSRWRRYLAGWHRTLG